MESPYHIQRQTVIMYCVKLKKVIVRKDVVQSSNGVCFEQKFL
jgi:hypothetical protein